MPTSNFSSAEEKEARRLLASAKPADNVVLLEWLGMLPAATSLDLLAKVAGEVPKRQSWIGTLVALTMIATLGWIIGIAFGDFHSVSPLVGPIFFALIGCNQQQNVRRSSRKAALLLSYRDDSRAIVPLTRLWNARSPKSASAAEENEAVEHALTRLLTGLMEKGNARVEREAISDLLERAFPSPKKRQMGVPEEFSESRADLLLAALRYISHATAGEESLQIRELITRIASYPVRGFAPNRRLISETAAACQNPEYRTVPRNAAEPVAQTLNIRL